LADDGQPYFAMEFIRGVALDEYVRRHRLDVAARLRLVAKVCDAVQHAHDKGVIHRDLKPSNILVDDSGQPKVLDFGVARATDADRRTTTLRTEAGQLVGTLNYMSPEQATADPAALDPRSDIYTLGVLLYELLGERLPYQLAHLPVLEVARVIATHEPSRLSALNTQFRGDVETIVAKALEKDKARRYPSAGELASDIRRHLGHEPIRAHPPSALYQLGKFARRNKALVGGLAGVVLASVVGAVFSIRFAVRAEHNAASAIAQKRVADEQKGKADFQTYRARLAAAAASLAGHDVADAARHLQEAPEELRNWEWHHLHSRLDDSFAVRTVPAGSSPLLFRGPNGFRLGVLTSTDLRLTDEDGPEQLALRLPPAHAIHAVGEVSAGLWIMARTADKHLHLLDEAGKVRLRLEAPPGGIDPIMAVSPDQTRLVMVECLGPSSFQYQLIETVSGKRLGSLESRADTPLALVFSPDGTHLVASLEDGTARVWDAATGARIATLGGPTGHTSKVIGAVFRPDGARLVTTSADGSVRQWDPLTGQQVEPPYERHTGEVVVAAYSPDGQWVASGGTDRTVRVWRATGRQDVAVLHGHTGVVTELAFSPDGRRLASGSRDRHYTYAHDNTLRLWEVDLQAGLPVLRGHTSYVYPVAYSPDGRWIASGSWDKTVRLWDARTGEPCAVLPHPDAVWGLAFSPDGTWLVTGCFWKEQLRVWDVATARLRKEIQSPGKHDKRLVVTHDGLRIASTAFDPKTFLRTSLIEAATGAEVFSFEGAAFAYSPDGKWLAGSSRDATTLFLWNAETHELSARFAGHEGPINSAVFSSDGRRLASCGKDRVVRVWEIATGKCQLLCGHTDEVFAVAFHPDGTRLASAGRDRAVWLWDLTTGEEVARLQGHATYIWSLAFSLDGATLVTGSGDGTVRLWDTAPLAKRHQARREAEALRPEAQWLVERLFQEKKNAAAVAAALRADEALAEPFRRAALQAVLRQATAPGP
ncbi:MAG: protein kinase, partial [Gemmataceae bacterium]|nr:protein kinase [Gemmataceae bacterium]